jgi:hypothetical protein
MQVSMPLRQASFVRSVASGLENALLKVAFSVRAYSTPFPAILATISLDQVLSRRSFYALVALPARL